MILSQETIIHLAKLSRLSLKKSEIRKYRRELGAVLAHVSQLASVNTDQVNFGSSKLANVWRADTALPWDREEVALALEQAGEKESGGIKVRRILV